MNSNPLPDAAPTMQHDDATSPAHGDWGIADEGVEALTMQHGDVISPAPPSVRVMRGAREFLWPLLFAMAIFTVSHTAIAYYEVDGTSMLPTVHTGQYVLVDTLSYRFHPPQRGDVIVFRFPLDTSQNFIKRVIAIPADTVSVNNGTVVLNGQAVKEPYVHLPATYSWPAHHVPPNTIVVLGDNRVVSYDSHLWSDNSGERPYVPDNLIIGRALFVYWPITQLAWLAGPTGVTAAH